MSKKKEGLVLWFTGLSGAGKSTLAEAVAPKLRAHGKRVEILDGDVVRTHLSKGLGFSREDRDTNIARIAFVAHLLQRNGVVVLVAAISPFRETREKARHLIGDFVEFTGISDPYEEPTAPELRIDTSRGSVDEGAGRILGKLRELGYLEAEGTTQSAGF
jgi:adenylylsulfate kinase-like enzyme